MGAVVTPRRIQLRRTKGWRKPAGAVVVARPSKWGNPFTIAKARECGYEGTDEQMRRMCVGEFRHWLRHPHSVWSYGAPQAERIMADIGELRGKDLACWCPLDQPCHADFLLELANGLES